MVERDRRIRRTGEGIPIGTSREEEKLRKLERESERNPKLEHQHNGVLGDEPSDDETQH